MPEVHPRPTIGFFLKNLPTLLRMKGSNKEKGLKFIRSTREMQQPLIPSFEGTGGPMEEGMIYLLFNSQGDPKPANLDSVFRVFWVDAPDLRFAFLDSYLISERLDTGQWARTFPNAIFTNRTKHKYHQEVTFEEYDMVCDGTWDKGYRFTLHDRKNHISGDLQFNRIVKEGVLLYYGGRVAVGPAMAQRFYDMFAFKVTGNIEVQGKKLEHIEGRGIIEHGLGILSTLDIYDWRWLNLQFDGGSMHFFYHSLDMKKEGIVESGEGAVCIDGKWAHFTPGTFEIAEVTYEKEPNMPTKVPVAWHVRAGRDFATNPRLDLVVKQTAHRSWIGAMGRENEYITNYVLEASGTWDGRHIEGKGTMENQMHRIIK